MSPLVRRLLLLLAVAGTAGGYLVSNAPSGGRFEYEKVPADRRPLDLRVDADPVPGVTNPFQVTQQLMNQWNSVSATEPLFGDAVIGGSYSGDNAKSAFGVFTNTTHEVAFDDDGSILAEYGLSGGVLGITLKVVDSDGDLLDFLVVVNTRVAALTPPAGSGATAEDLFRGTLLHELGHALGLGHSPVGIASETSYGLLPAQAAQMATMFPFRLPLRPQEGATLEDDDRAAVRFRYAAGSDGTGSISGRVRGASGAAANELAVRAVGPGNSDESHVGTLTNTDGADDGNYRITGLPPGGYRVLIETVDGRGGVDGDSLAGVAGSLGSNPFVLARDELWQPGDAYDPDEDDPADFAVVQVRAGRDTGRVDFVLNAVPLTEGGSANGALEDGDARVPDGSGDGHFTDFFVFAGTAGESLAFQVAATGFTPQVRLHRPGGFGAEVEQRPTFGSSVLLEHTLERSGVYTIAVFARGVADSIATGQGTYTVQLEGSGGALPAPLVPTPPSIERGAASPVDPAFGSPSERVGVLQLRVAAGSAEEFWLDELVVHASGTGDDRAHVSRVRLVHDEDGDGEVDGDEPTLASGTFDADDGSVRFESIELEVGAGAETHLLVALDVDVPAPAVPAASGALAALLGLLLAAPLLRSRRRLARGLLLGAALLAPLSCGGGGGGGGTSFPRTAFDPAQPSFTFALSVGPGDVESYTSAGDPASPVAAPASTLDSDPLTVSQRP